MYFQLLEAHRLELKLRRLNYPSNFDLGIECKQRCKKRTKVVDLQSFDQFGDTLLILFECSANKVQKKMQKRGEARRGKFKIILLVTILKGKIYVKGFFVEFVT